MKPLLSLAQAICACALLAAAGAVGAHPVGFGNAGIALATSHPFSPNLPGWIVQDEATGGPIAITAVPDNRPWQKDLILPITPGAAVIPFSTTYTVVERLVVGQPGFPGPAWTDWHEHILDPLWDWVSGTILIEGGRTAPGLVVSLGPPGLPPESLGHSPDIWFDFDPLPPGTSIEIVKQIHCHGPNGCPIDGVIRIVEWPTIVPAPATTALLLLGLALASLATRRRT